MAHTHGGVGYREHHRRRAEEGISPPVHGHRSGMIGLAAHRDLEVRGARDRRDDTQARPMVLEDRPLLDVELDEDIEIAADGRRRGRRIEPDRTHGVAERHAVSVTRAIRLTRFEPIGDRSRAPEIRVEPAPLLLADRKTLEDSRGPAEPLPQRAYRLDPRHDAEGPVERAAAAHRVDMRAGRDDAPTARPFDPSPYVADGVPLHEESRFFHPAAHEVHRRGPGRRVQRPVDTAGGKRAALREIVEPAQESALVDLHKVAHRDHAHPSATYPRGMNRPRAGLVTVSRSL